MGRRNLVNAVVAILAPLPSIILYLYFLQHYQELTNASGDGEYGGSSFAASLWNWCFHHPLLLANVLFFFNVNLLFWIISHIQSSHWMISLYWTVIPVMLVHYYATHPSGSGHYNWWRSRIVVLLTWVWALRLNHSYLRKEKWQLGAREDWRFTDMRAQYGSQWWWVSFLAIYVAQQLLLIGVCLPLYAIHTTDKPLNILDCIAVLVSVSGIITAYLADTQLHNFVTCNEKLKEVGKFTASNILNKGLWRYSRHPNYLGEQLWWWGLGIFAWNLGQGWTLVGPLVNSMCLAYVTMLVERRMLKESSRAEAYKLYQKTTSVWIPWLKISKDKTT